MQRTKMANSSSYQGGSSSNHDDVIAKETKRVLNAPSIEHLLARNGKNDDLANVKINQNKIILTRSSERTEREIRSIMHYFRLSRYKMNTKFELECWEIDNKGMEVLGFQISRHLSNLQELSLAFSACWEITDKGVEILISQIARSLVNLKRLSLDFSACEQITDKAVKVIGSEICKHMINLQRLNLDFHNCVEITDTGVKALGSEITRRLVKLQQLGLICNSCSQITNQSIQILGSDIARRLANLHRLSLIFSSSKVTLQCKQKLRTLLRFIPSIRIY